VPPIFGRAAITLGIGPHFYLLLCAHSYLRHTLDQYVENDYTVVYFHHGLDRRSKPSFSWLRQAYSEFDRKSVNFVFSAATLLLLLVCCVHNQFLFNWLRFWSYCVAQPVTQKTKVLSASCNAVKRSRLSVSISW